MPHHQGNGCARPACNRPVRMLDFGAGALPCRGALGAVPACRTRGMSGRLVRMAVKKSKGQSGVATLINGIGFLIAVLLVLHIVFVLFGVPGNTGLARSVEQAAVPLALFFPGLVEAPGAELQVLLDFGLAAVFWMVVAGLLARVVG